MSLSVGERLAALGKGEKIRDKQWLPGYYIHLVDGRVVDERGVRGYEAFLVVKEDYELYKEPALEITPLDVGRVAVFEDGVRSLIIAFRSEWGFSVRCNGRVSRVDGTNGSNDPKIIKVVNVGEE